MHDEALVEHRAGEPEQTEAGSKASSAGEESQGSGGEDQGPYGLERSVCHMIKAVLEQDEKRRMKIRRGSLERPFLRTSFTVHVSA